MSKIFSFKLRFHKETLRHCDFLLSFPPHCHVLLLFFLLLLALPRPSMASRLSSPWLMIIPKKISQGSIALVTYRGPNSLRPEGITWHQTTFPFFKNNRGIYQAFVATPLSMRQQRQFFTLIVSSRDRHEKSGFGLMVYKRRFHTIVLHLKKRAMLTPQLLTRIKQEHETLRQILARQTPKKFWDGPFVKPVPGRVTSPFGTRRKINGTYVSIHHGTDFRAPMGTPVKAINAGIVVYRGEMVLSGKTVVIDHGKGLYSLYGHLSAPKVRVNDKISKGQVIGLSGNTGRATGPHLHLGVFLCGFAVDPLSLIYLSL